MYVIQDANSGEFYNGCINGNYLWNSSRTRVIFDEQEALKLREELLEKGEVPSDEPELLVHKFGEEVI